MTAEMQARLQLSRNTLNHIQAGLKSFQESKAKFKILATIDNRSFETADAAATRSKAEQIKTLFILDSSFNPPSIAHQALAETALHKSSSDAYPLPHRLLLLFSTGNAEKAPSAASFDQRLLMMNIFASDLLRKLASQADDYSVPTVDVGVTTAPYYTDKTYAIEQEASSWYLGKPKHVHLIGYDALARVFTAKYYKDSDPPFSVLEPYFSAGHEMRATLRAGNDFGSIEDQKAFLEKLRSGGMKADGGKPEWAEQVHLVAQNPKTGVSSTKIRTAANAGDWQTVQELCTPTVAEWVKQEHLYADDARGSKMW